MIVEEEKLLRILQDPKGYHLFLSLLLGGGIGALTMFFYLRINIPD